jgi:hypothetical protein
MPEQFTPRPEDAKDNGFFVLPHKFDFDNPIEVADLSQRGISPENDASLDELEAWEKFYAESERLIHIDPDSTHHYS